VGGARLQEVHFKRRIFRKSALQFAENQTRSDFEEAQLQLCRGF
jgi:hypothetical protein